MSEAGASASEDYIRSDRQLETTPEAETPHGCDGQNWKLLPLIDRGETPFEGRTQFRRCQSGPRNDIASIAEVRSFRGQKRSPRTASGDQRYPRVTVRTVPILRPLPHVSSHVVEAEGIRRFAANSVGLLTGIIIVPTIRVALS